MAKKRTQKTHSIITAYKKQPLPLKKFPTLPNIPESEETPIVKGLLHTLEKCLHIIHQQSEEIALLKDEVKVLKGEKKRPVFKPSKMDEKTDKPKVKKLGSKKKTKRPGSQKRSKNATLTIHEERVIQPKNDIPAGSRFKGYRDFIVQELMINTQNTRYRLARWETPDGQTLIGELPQELNGRHYGSQLLGYVLYQHYHCHVTQPLLLEQLREWGVDISSGEVNRLLSEGKELFHQEKDAILATGLTLSNYITVDDSGARHKGKNGYVTQIGNDHFTWFQSTDSKNRINFLELLRADDNGYRVNQHAESYWKDKGLSCKPLTRLLNSKSSYIANASLWEEHFDQLEITSKRHRRIATEGALLGNVQHLGLCQDLVIVSDGAGEFNILRHALCWIHTERLVHTLLPLNEKHRLDIAKVRGEIWDFYRDLKNYKKQPNDEQKIALIARFEVIFTQRTCYEVLNKLLKRIYNNQSELLMVLTHPDIPLHTNGSETDIRDYVKKRKVSGGTRSDLGRQCRDTFISIKKTCRKVGISFWHYLLDRILGLGDIPPLSVLIQLAVTAEQKVSHPQFGIIYIEM